MKILYANESKNWLDSIEEQIAQNFMVVCYNRLMFVGKMQKFFEEVASQNKIDILDGWTEKLKNGLTFSQTEREITHKLHSSRNEDRQSGRGSISANGTEYEIIFDAKRVQFCSSGQQKLMGAILTLATSYFAKKQNWQVITLLDDITAKIDEKNQEYLTSIINFAGTQTIISTIEKPKGNCFCITL
jgi:recombinational DNA repair ATPase RecF